MLIQTPDEASLRADCSLIALSDRIEQARVQIEARFSDAGGRLASSLEMVGALILSLDHIGKVLNEDAVADTRASLLATADDLSGLPAAQRQRLDRITRLHDAGRTLAAHIEDMRQTLRYLRAFAMNVKITAGGIAAAGDEFTGFAEQMCDQLDVGGRELEQLSGELASLDRHLVDAMTREEALGASYDNVIPAVPDRLAIDAHAISAHHSRIAEVTASVASLARAIQMKVARALTAMQIGDITRQRIEHVQLGLQVTSRYAGDPGLSPEAGARFRRKLVRLLADQMADTAAAFEHEAAKVAQNLSGMADDTARILAFDSLSDARASDGLRDLESRLGEAHLLIEDVSTAIAGADRIRLETASAVTALARRVGAIQTVKRDIQQMAINSSLRCGRLGEAGRPLNVIALELGGHAGQLETSADQTLASLARLGEVASDLSDGSVTGIDATHINAAGGRLRQAADVIDNDLAALGRKGEATARSLADATGQLALRDDLGESLHAAAVALTEEAGRPEETGADIADAVMAAMSEISRSYTMARERDIHATHEVRPLGAPDAPAAEPAAGIAPAAANDEEFADILF